MDEGNSSTQTGGGGLLPPSRRRFTAVPFRGLPAGQPQVPPQQLPGQAPLPVAQPARGHRRFAPRPIVLPPQGQG